MSDEMDVLTLVTKKSSALVVFEDFRATAIDMDPEVVDLVITSPPYFVDKDYEIDWTWIGYLDFLDELYRAVARVLKPGGYFCINFGDQARGRNIRDTETFSTIPMAIYHWRSGAGHALELTGTRIWRKIFHRMGVPFVCNNHPRHVFDYEHLWTWRKPNGDYRSEVVHDRKLSQRGVLEFEDDHPLERFPAAFPVGLPRWCMEVYSEEGDLVWDPCTGSGTTGLAALQLGRHFTGNEIQKDYKPIIQEVLGGASED